MVVASSRAGTMTATLCAPFSLATRSSVNESRGSVQGTVAKVMAPRLRVSATALDSPRVLGKTDGVIKSD